MAFELNEDMFKEQSATQQTDYLPEGVHKVTILEVEKGAWPDETVWLDLTVGNKSGAIAKQRLTFNDEKGAKAVQRLYTIFVHNTEESKRDKMKSALKALNSVEKLMDLSIEKLSGKEAWVDVVVRPNNKYPLNLVTGYEPTHWVMDGAQTAVKSVFPEAEKVDLPDDF